MRMRVRFLFIRYKGMKIECVFKERYIFMLGLEFFYVFFFWVGKESGLVFCFFCCRRGFFVL